MYTHIYKYMRIKNPHLENSAGELNYEKLQTYPAVVRAEATVLFTSGANAGSAPVKVKV